MSDSDLQLSLFLTRLLEKNSFWMAFFKEQVILPVKIKPRLKLFKVGRLSISSVL